MTDEYAQVSRHHRLLLLQRKHDNSRRENDDCEKGVQKTFMVIMSIGKGEN